MDIKALIENHQVIVTPNQRLSAALLAQYESACLASGKQSWLTPTIVAFDHWLIHHFNHYQATHATTPLTLINDMQSLQCWKTFTQPQPTAIAKLAQSAWQTLRQWQQHTSHPSFNDNEDTRAFKQWADNYEAHCQQQHYIHLCELPPLLQTYLVAQTDSIAWFGFIELTPAQQQLVDAFQAQDKLTRIDTLNAKSGSTQYRYSLPSQAHEINAIAAWAKDQWQTNPTQQLACIFPNLPDVREQVLAAFKQVFDEPVYNISAGKPLLHYPVIASALQLLELNLSPLRLDTISHYLKTPFITQAETELNQRMQADALLRRENKTTLSLSEWVRFTQKHCPLLATALETLSPQQQHQSPNAWAMTFSEQLQQLGWPGERVLDSLEYQTVQRFLSIFDQFAALDAFSGKLSAQAALQQLRYLCSNTIFQAKTEAAPIQILGLLEAGGLSFDKVWLSGLDDNTWPAPLSPNPFLPYSLQRQQQMPHASHTREFNFTEHLTKQLCQSANTVIVSYASSHENLAQRPSKLIEGIEEKTLPDYLKTTDSDDIAFQTENYQNDQVPPFCDQQAKGGTSLFKYQANCAFQAFAYLRLHAEALPNAYYGLNAAERGTILHKVLELVWQTLENSDKLHQIDEQERRHIIQQAIDKTLHPYPLNATLKALESERLLNLTDDWLSLEKTRESFHIHALEQTQQVTFNGLTITIRADRVDALANGKHVVIDYKTKKTTANDWFGEQLREPQLPFYALHDPDATRIAFAQVRRDGMKLVEMDSHQLEKNKNEFSADDWQTQKSYWHYDLTTLAEQFKTGHAHVAPRDAQTCQHCDLQTLCRIHQQDEVPA